MGQKYGARAGMNDTADRLYEAALVLRCQAGDHVAFAELIERYEPRLRYYVRKMLGQRQSTEDVLQDVWLAVFRGVPRLANVTAFRAWLYRITHDRVVGEIRRRPPAHEQLRDADLVDDQGEETRFSQEDAKAIHAALDSLSSEHREVLVFRYLEEMNYEDIAQIVGCRLGTVRSRLHYAKLALRCVLEGRTVHEQ